MPYIGTDMNERLKELAEQAKIQLTKPTNYATALAADGQLKALEKFAELIIRDCLYQVRKDIGPDDDYHSDWNMGMEHGAEAIEEHFGVEK